MPGLFLTPISRGRLSRGGRITFLSRRYFTTTSHTGSPDTPSVTGAQLATLYFFRASIGLPFNVMLAMRLPIFCAGSQLNWSPPTRTMSPPCW
ncbi:hypothetical protein D3C83_52840 [compost metagenome]